MVAKALGDVGSQPNVSRGQPVLEMHIPVMQPTDCQSVSQFSSALVADKLGHRPRFQRGPMLAQSWPVPNHDLDQLALAFPECGEQLAFFFRSEQVRRKDCRG